MSSNPFDIVNVLRFCHQVTVLGKCHHEGEGDIEQERAEEVGGVKPGRGGQDDWQGSK